VLAGIVVGVVAGHPVSWIAGAFSGMGAAAWGVIRESPPPHVENWQTGAEGERKTARALRGLDSSRWLVVHDVPCERGNYDHVLVGATGVFLLDTKYPQGQAHIRNNALWVRRLEDPEADAPCAWPRGSALGAAAGLSGELQRRTGERVWVEAVVVLWCPFDQGVFVDGPCTFVHGSKLRGWLEGQPDRLSDSRAGELSKAIGELATQHT
jgi:hypothetical protein